MENGQFSRSMSDTAPLPVTELPPYSEPALPAQPVPDDGEFPEAEDLPAQPGKKKRSPVKAFFSGLLDLLLMLPAAAAATGTLLAVFFCTVAADFRFPAVLGYRAETVQGFMGSVWPAAICAAVLVLLLLMILLKNHRSAPRVFLLFGLILALTAGLCIALGVCGLMLAPFFPEATAGSMRQSMEMLRPLLQMAALGLLVLASVMFSLCMTVRFVQREREARNA